MDVEQAFHVDQCSQSLHRSSTEREELRAARKLKSERPTLNAIGLSRALPDLAASFVLKPRFNFAS